MGQGFPVSSAGKESVCNIGDPGSIPGWGRSTGEGIGYPLQYSWASLVAQLVKNPPAMAGDLDLIPGLGRSPGEEKGHPLRCSGLENSMDCIPWGLKESSTTERLSPPFPSLTPGSAFPFRRPSSQNLSAYFSTIFLLLLARTFSGCPGFFSRHHLAFLFLLHTFPDEK